MFGTVEAPVSLRSEGEARNREGARLQREEGSPDNAQNSWSNTDLFRLSSRIRSAASLLRRYMHTCADYLFTQRCAWASWVPFALLA